MKFLKLIVATLYALVTFLGPASEEQKQKLETNKVARQQREQSTKLEEISYRPARPDEISSVKVSRIEEVVSLYDEEDLIVAELGDRDTSASVRVGFRNNA